MFVRLCRRVAASWSMAHSLAAIVAYNLALLAWVVLKPAGPTVFVAVDNITQFVGPLLIVPWYLRRQSGRAGAGTMAQWAPRLIGLGVLCEALGQIIFTIYQQVLRVSPPFPSWADAVYLWSYPFLLLGILLLPGLRLPAAARWRVLLDGVMIMIALVTFSWYFILGPTLAESGGTWLANAVGLAYPLGDLVLIACVLMLRSRLEKRELRQVVALLSGGLAIIVATDTVYDYQNLHGGYATGGVLDVGWPLGYMVVALSGYALRAALSARAGTAEDETDGTSPDTHAAGPSPLWSSLLPAALVPLVGVLLLYTCLAGTGGQSTVGISVGATLLIAVVVLRQVLTILENRRLYAQLDADYLSQARTLAQREQQMHTVVANAPIILWAVDRTGRCTLYEGQGLAAVNHAPGHYVGQHMVEVCRAQPRMLDAMRRALAGEANTLVDDSGPRVYETSWTPVRDATGAVEGAIAVSHDITQRRRAEEALQHQAFHDALTGLPNRALFMDRLEHALARANRRAGTVAVLFLDLDRFKVVNDSLGHATGDLLLMAVAERLRGCVREEDTVARFGGDEFAVLLGEVDASNEPVLAAERIIAALEDPFRLGGHDIVTATSIGIVASTSAHTPADMLRDADVALYRAKARGRGRFEVFDEAMNAQAMERLEMEADMRAGLEGGEFEVYYQPKVALATGCVEGMEALVRWQHPRRGLIAPAAFIPLAEETGLIRPLGQWVLEEACRQTKRWREQMPDVRIVTSVNLSARQFQQPTLVADVEAALRQSGVDPRQIQLEITEGVAMDDAEAAVATLQQLKALGVQLAIDDFGTGYSSLAYLKRFPVDELKIDRAFVSGLLEGSDDASIVHAVTSLGHALNLSIVAEGIETAEESQHIRRLGCEIGQGYYFAKPLPPAAASDFLKNNVEHTARHAEPAA